jgi:TonB family protein
MTLAWALKATWILGAALVAVGLMRRRPAAVRFATLAAAMAGLLALPLVEAAWPRRVSKPSEVPASVLAVTVSSEPVAETQDWTQIVWLAGVLFCLGRAGVGYVLSQRRLPLVPMTVGVLRPRIVLPDSASEWSAELRRSVILHEKAHIARHDPVWNFVAQIARAVYWFHPLAWWALHRMHTERERACDDAVLAAGVRPSDYATHLMVCARSGARFPGAALAMAGRSQLSSRVAAILSTSIKRDNVTLSQRSVLAAGCLALLLPLAAFGSPSFSFRSLPMFRKLTLPFLAAAAMAQSAELSGRIYDASSATVPTASVVLRSRDTSAEFKTVSGPAGEYRITGLPGGSYDLEVSMPGFARYQRRGIKLTDASVATVSSVLSLGEVQEEVQVTAPGQARPQPQPAPRRILVGGSVRPVRLLKQTRAAYPDAARAEGREGNVVLRAVIGVNGAIVNVRVLPGADADFAAAAEEAVRQWQYEPTLLNGKPVETVTTIEMNFRLGAA